MYLHPHVAHELARARMAELHGAAAPRSRNAPRGGRGRLRSALLSRVVNPLRAERRARMAPDHMPRIGGAS